MANLTPTEKWFKSNVVENEKELIEIGELSNKMLHEKLCLGLSNPRTTIAIYGTIFETILSVVLEEESSHESFFLNLANQFNIGFTNRNSDDEEKSGNFMIFMQHIDAPPSNNTLSDDESTDTIEICTQWNAMNIKTQSNIIRDIACKAKKNLSNIINLPIESHEFIIPMFCVIHSQLLSYIMIKRQTLELARYEINVAGLFTVGVQETDNAEEEIYYEPSITLKLTFKNDASASKDN